MPRGPKGERRPADVIGAAVKHHQALALRTFGTFDCNWRNAGMLRLGFRHDASLKQAGAQNSLSPVDADGWAGDGTSMIVGVPKFRVRKANGPQARGQADARSVWDYRRSLGMTKFSQCVEFASGTVRPVPSVSLRWKGAGFYWPADSAGTVYINQERQGEISMGRLRRRRGAEHFSLEFGHRSDLEFRLPIPNWNPLGRILGKPGPKPKFRDEMTGFRKARRFQRDCLAIIDFYNVGTELSIQYAVRRVRMHG